MADTQEKRLSDLEYVVVHLPGDLDARFAGVDAKLAPIREVQALHTTRFSTIEHKLGTVGFKLDAMDQKLDRLIEALGGPAE